MMGILTRMGGWLTDQVQRLGHRLQTAGELLWHVGGRRPWLLPVLAGLLVLTGLVALAQASQIAPLIYTLF